MTHHAFTVPEANEALPSVRAALGDIRRVGDGARGHLDKLAVLDALWGDLVTQPENPDHKEYLEHRHALTESQRTIQGIIQDRLIARHIRFPAGGLEHGLVDFPTTLDGRWVYLCWQSDEPEVAYWHEVNAGFGGRRPVTAEERERMGRADDPARHDDSALDF